VLLLGLLGSWRNQELRNAAKLGQMVLKDKRDRLAEVVDKVPTVGNLNGLWSTSGGGTGIVCASITTDHLNVRTRFEPGGGSSNGTVCEQVNDPMGFQID
jgi:hypothetical protein